MLLCIRSTKTTVSVQNANKFNGIRHAVQMAKRLINPLSEYKPEVISTT